MVEKICGKGEFWAWNETSDCVMEVESGEQVGGELVCVCVCVCVLECTCPAGAL